MRLFDRARDIRDDKAARFLINRGVEPPFPTSLRWRSMIRGDDPSAMAILGAVSPLHRPHSVVALARVWASDGASNLYEPSAASPLTARGCGVVMGQLGTTICVGERVIDTLLAARLAELPAVAAVLPQRLGQLELPTQVRRVIVAHDAEPSDDSVAAIERLISRIRAFGVDTALLAPPIGFATWSDYGRASARRVRHG